MATMIRLIFYFPHFSMFLAFPEAPLIFDLQEPGFADFQFRGLNLNRASVRASMVVEATLPSLCNTFQVLSIR